SACPTARRTLGAPTTHQRSSGHEGFPACHGDARVALRRRPAHAHHYPRNAEHGLLRGGGEGRARGFQQPRGGPLRAGREGTRLMTREGTRLMTREGVRLMTDRSPSVTSEAWQKALDCAYSIMEDYFAKPHISTEAGRKKALDEAMQHAFGMLSLGLAQRAI